ncbi:hypothetical protein TRFO_02619 [Tritrichomonas foetus]|uniref:Uncharacterized protein n=1 Tax=Tritrichomonas foetus TaxID=1144522 RepID=A0A1J4L217_9EUKA|nr:hypothetical protein TRFO_02619 [Tritrichomonas foetus]|eukprot:OHT17553.1 hypothetical protein TRFO_02619 [Tritrichomonas foetus]
MAVVLHINQEEAQSFEISRWFSSVINRLDCIQNRNYFQQIWIKMALKIRNKRRISALKYCQQRYKQQKFSRSTKFFWISFYSKLWHRRKKRIFNLALTQLQEARQKADDLKRAKKLLKIPDSESESVSSDSYDGTNSESSEISPNNKRWISIALRFLRQTKYLELQQAFDDYKVDKNYQRRERQDTWRYFSHSLIWNIEKRRIRYACKKHNEAKQNWKYLYSNYMLSEKLKALKSEYSKWHSLSMKTDIEVRRVWKRMHFALRHKQNIIRIVKESSALSTLTNFFRYILIPNRAKTVASYFQIRYIGTIRAMTKTSTLDSAERIHRFASHKVVQENIAFASNWSSCIAEAFSSVAYYQLGPPSYNKPKPKPSNKCFSFNKSKSSKDPTTKENYKKSQNKYKKYIPPIEQPLEKPDYPTKIIKITRDFDPNEEESEVEVSTFLSESGDEEEIKTIKYPKTTHTEIKRQKDEQVVVVSSPNFTLPKKGKDIAIVINPSDSQSTPSMSADVSETIDQNETTNNTHEKQKPKAKRNNYTGSNSNLKVKPSTQNINEKNKPIIKPKKKITDEQLELYAPIVVPEGKRTKTPLKKKRYTKPNKDIITNVSAILGIVGIDSSLEPLDEEGEEYSEINFNFDDDESSVITSSPEDEYIVDLMKLNSNSGEERRIKQSLLEASEAVLTDPNERDAEEEEEKHSVKNIHESKINSPKPSTNVDGNDPNSFLLNQDIESSSSAPPPIKPGLTKVVLPQPDLSSSPSSYCSSNSDKHFEEEQPHVATNIPKIRSTRLNPNADSSDTIQSVLDNETLLQEEEETMCEFQFNSENPEEEIYEPIANSQSLNESIKSENANSYMSDHNDDATMHEYSSDHGK